MSIQHAGYATLTWAWVIGAAALDSVVIVSAIIGALVAISTLMIRIGTLIENRVESTINRMQSSGDLPTAGQWDHVVASIDAIHDELRRGGR